MRDGRAIIDYATAKQRLGGKLRVVESDFRSLTKGAERMAYTVFQRQFVGSILPNCPEQLVRCLYVAFKRCCGSPPATARELDGLTISEFTRGLALLRYGTAVERMRFLYYAYCDDSWKLAKTTLASLIRLFPDEGKGVIADLTDPKGAWAKPAAFQSDEEFSEWAMSCAHAHPNEPHSVVLWMYEFEDMLSREGLRSHHYELVATDNNKSYAEEKARSLASITGLSQGKVNEILSIHKKLQMGSATGTLDRKTFSASLPSLPESLREQLFRVLDSDHTDSVSVKDLLSAVAMCSQGDREQKLEFCFRLFDTAASGSLNKGSFKELVEALWNVERIYRGSHSFASLGEEDSMLSSGELLSPSAKSAKTKALVESAFPDKKEKMSQEEFIGWVDGHELGEQFVQAVWRVALIDLSVRPATPEEELSVVKQLNTPPFHPQQALGSVGATWYLIDRTWYTAWEHSLGVPPGSTTVFSPNRPEWGSQDQIDADEDGEDSASLQWHTPVDGLPRLDNKRLLDSNGKLRTGLDWAGDRIGADCYEVLTQGAWRALASWYSASPAEAEIARRVIEVDGRQELELHPPYIRIFRGLPGDRITANLAAKNSREAVFSSSSTLHDVLRHAAAMMRFDATTGIMWECKASSQGSLEFQRLTPLESTLRDRDIVDGTTYMVGNAAQLEAVSFSTTESEVTVTPDMAEGAQFKLHLSRKEVGAEDQTLTATCVDITSNMGDGDKRFVQLKLRRGGAIVAVLHMPTGGSAPQKVEETVGKLTGMLDVSGVDVQHYWADGSEDSTCTAEELDVLPSGMSVEYIPDEAGDKRHRASMRAGTVIYASPDGVKVLPNESFRGRPIFVPRNHVTKKLDKTSPSSFGCVGLQNLANTCYMNSTVQALSHLRPIREYFLSDRYCYDLNKEPTKGLGGKLSLSFAELLEKLWSTDKSYIPPRNFRHLMGSYRDEYATSHQQDATDFLLTLLEGIGDELNLVRKKRKVEGKVTPDAPDPELAELSWKHRTASEDSFLLSMLAYQQHNARVCSSCKKTSKTVETLFPPLPLALPSPDELHVDVLLHRPGEKLLHLTVTLKLKATTNDLMKAVSVLVQRSVPAYNLVALDLSSDGRRFELPAWKGKELVSRRIQALPTGTPVHIYEARGYSSPSTAASEPRQVLVQAVHRRLIREKSLFGAPYRPHLLGMPLMVSTPEGSGEKLYEIVWMAVRHLVPDFVLRKDSDGGGGDFGGYPFVLTRVKPYGTECSDCGWARGCIGCKIESNAQPHSVHHRDTIGIDWDVDVYEDEYKKLVETAIDEDPSVAQARQQEKARKACDVMTCLRSYFSTSEVVDGRVKCDFCSEMAGKRGTSRLHALPAILVLQLKRFTWSDRGQQKIFTHVDFPLKGLDLKEVLTDGATPLTGLPSTMSRTVTQYDLAAVINHEGAQTTWGHYYSYVRLKDGKWVSMNDSKSAPLKPEDVVSSKAYLLYYVRRDVETMPLEELWPLRGSSPQSLDIAKVKKDVQGAQHSKAKPLAVGKSKNDPCGCVVA